MQRKDEREEKITKNINATEERDSHKVDSRLTVSVSVPKPSPPLIIALLCQDEIYCLTVTVAEKR